MRIFKQMYMLLGSKGMLINSIFRDYYFKKVSEGKLKHQALKCIQRRLINIIFNTMKHNRPYDNPDLGYVPLDKQTA